jgi:hypothetical protein
LGVKPTISKITKVGQTGPKSNTTQLTTASTNDCFNNTNIKDSMITDKENRDETMGQFQMELDYEGQTKEQHHTLPPHEENFTMDNKTMLANILMNTISSNKKMELL